EEPIIVSSFRLDSPSPHRSVVANHRSPAGLLRVDVKVLAAAKLCEHLVSYAHVRQPLHIAGRRIAAGPWVARQARLDVVGVDLELPCKFFLQLANWATAVDPQVHR